MSLTRCKRTEMTPMCLPGLNLSRCGRHPRVEEVHVILCGRQLMTLDTELGHMKTLVVFIINY